MTKTSIVTDTLGRPLRDLRISVTDRCNFRCPYCMPVEIYGEDYGFSPRENVLTFEETTRLVKLFALAGTEKIRLTGGEPLLRKNLEELIAQIAHVPGIKEITLTTNGVLLADRVKDLKAAGLTRVTVSLDALDEATFGKMNGRGIGPEKVLAGIEAALAEGLAPIKINAVIKRGENEHSVLALAEKFKGTGVIVRYIEFMDVGNRNGWKLDHVFPASEIVGTIGEKFPLEPAEANYPGEVARRYRYLDGGGEIGVIASITQPFCQDCSRARLSTSGELVTCLFAQGGINLRDPLRNGLDDTGLLEMIQNNWKGRKDRYSEVRFEKSHPPRKKIEMYQIGG